jgi:hypothetical protein
MTRLGATHVVSFPGGTPVAGDCAAGVAGKRGHRLPDGLVREAIESLRDRCRAAEDAATAAAAAESRARAELLRMRQVCQQMLEATALEVLELKRELQARDRMATDRGSDSSQSPAMLRPTADVTDDEIPFDRIEAVLAASPL